jgi:RimJ/RimL family protein N-acetyltransferase
MILNITGERVALGPLVREHLALHARWINDVERQRTAGDVLEPQTAEQLEAWYERRTAESDTAVFTLYAREHQDAPWEPIGFTMLRDIDFRNRTAEYAISIGPAAARGRGYGSEATFLMLDYAFTALGLNNVLLTTASFNQGGLRAYQKAGFREIGRRRHCWQLAGQLYDEVFMECLAGDFPGGPLRDVFVPDTPRAPLSSFTLVQDDKDDGIAND